MEKVLFIDVAKTQQLVVKILQDLTRLINC